MLFGPSARVTTASRILAVRTSCRRRSRPDTSVRRIGFGFATRVGLCSRWKWWPATTETGSTSMSAVCPREVGCPRTFISYAYRPQKWTFASFLEARGVRGPVGLSRQRLRVALHERRVAPAAGAQLLVCATLHDAARVQDHDLVRVAHRGQAVGDRDRGAALGETVQRLLHGS